MLFYDQSADSLSVLLPLKCIYCPFFKILSSSVWIFSFLLHHVKSFSCFFELLQTLKLRWKHSRWIIILNRFNSKHSLLILQHEFVLLKTIWIMYAFHKKNEPEMKILSMSLFYKVPAVVAWMSHFRSHILIHFSWCLFFLITAKQVSKLAYAVQQSLRS